MFESLLPLGKAMADPEKPRPTSPISSKRAARAEALEGAISAASYYD